MSGLRLCRKGGLKSGRMTTLPSAHNEWRGPLHSENLIQCSGSKVLVNVKMLEKANQSVEEGFTVKTLLRAT